MSVLSINAKSVGEVVRNASRPEWGDGRILRVQEVRQAGTVTHRVSVQFAIAGHKTLLVPPAQLVRPTAERERTAGWLDQLGGRTPDDALCKLPEQATDVLGTLRDRLAAVLPLYAHSGTGAELVTWARRQTGVADPLSHWNRDELETAFVAFGNERDAHLRGLAAQLRMKEGPEAIREFLNAVPAPLRSAVHAALTRVI